MCTLRNFRTLLISLLSLVLLCASVAAQSAEERMRGEKLAASKILQSGSYVDPKTSPAPSVVKAGADLRSPREKKLSEDLKAARKARDYSKTARLWSLLSPAAEKSAQCTRIATPQVTFFEGVQTSSAGSRFGDDILVVNESFLDSDPDMVSAASGTLYLVNESDDTTAIHLYRSFDGGKTWYLYVTAAGGSAGDIADPAITVPEIDHNYLFTVYAYANQIQVMRINIAQGAVDFYNVESSSLGVYRPRIATDNCEYPGNYYVYVVYEAGHIFLGGTVVKASRSIDDGMTWSTPQILGGEQYHPGFPAPDICFGCGSVFVTWCSNMSDQLDIMVSRSTDFAVNWEPKVNLTTSNPYDCFDARVVASQNGSGVVSTYTMDYYGDMDLKYAYSTSKGVSWYADMTLSNTTQDEKRADICVSHNLGQFHVVYWKNYDIICKYAGHSTPYSWSAAETVNDTNDASSFFTPTVAEEPNSGKAGVAWSDFRISTYGIYFDRADFSSASDPVPDIEINDQDGPLSIPSTQSVLLTVSLDPGNLEGVAHDWWVKADLSGGSTFWWSFPNLWFGSQTRAHTGPLVSVNDFVIRNGTIPKGSWVLTFAVDALNNVYEGTYKDTIQCTVY